MSEEEKLFNLIENSSFKKDNIIIREDREVAKISSNTYFDSFIVEIGTYEFHIYKNCSKNNPTYYSFYSYGSNCIIDKAYDIIKDETINQHRENRIEKLFN